MNALNAYRLPTGELVLPPDDGELMRRFLNSDFFGFITVFVVSLTALAIAGS